MKGRSRHRRASASVFPEIWLELQANYNRRRDVSTSLGSAVDAAPKATGVIHFAG